MLAAGRPVIVPGTQLRPTAGAGIALGKLKVVHAYITPVSYFAQPDPCFATYACFSPGVGNHA